MDKNPLAHTKWRCQYHIQLQALLGLFKCFEHLLLCLGVHLFCFQACAAFFRRSVAMSMTYECIGTGDDETPCKIHYELRMLCRHCRFIKCLEAGMRRERE